MESDSLRLRLLDKLLDKGYELTYELRAFRDSLLVEELNDATERLERACGIR